MSVDHMLMAFGAVGVAMYQPWVTIFAQQRGNCGIVHIHDRAVLVLFGSSALPAQLFYVGFACRERLGEKAFLELRIMYLCAKFLILDIICAQRVTVSEQRGRAIQVKQGRVRQ